MNDAKALEEIKRLALLPQRVKFTRHCRERMDERGAIAADVVAALLSATSAEYQTDKQNFRVDGGVDTDGEALTAIVDLQDDVIVVTMF